MKVIIGKYEMSDVSVAFHLTLVHLAERKKALLFGARVNCVPINGFNKRNRLGNSRLKLGNSGLLVFMLWCFHARHSG